VIRRLAPLGLAVALTACSFGSGTEPPFASAIAAAAATNGQAGTVGRPLPKPVGAVVVDPNGNPVSGVTVTWAVADSTGSIGTPTSVTGADGIATMTWILDTIARVDSLTASIPSGASTTITAFGVAGAPKALVRVSGNAQSIVAGSTSLPLVIEVTDAYGNPVSGVAVVWAVTGGGSLSASSTTTGENGQAYVTLTTDAAPASYTVTAAAGALAPATFALAGR
jgi:hypothetical protein